jgi:hypothetical protein
MELIPDREPTLDVHDAPDGTLDVIIRTIDDDELESLRKSRRREPKRAWRGLQIDGSSVAAFEESISRLEQELPSAYRRQIFALALGDVAVDSKVVGYSDEDYRAQLDGLTYNGVIALADQTGASVKRQYYSGRTYQQALEERWRHERVDAKTAPHFPPSPDYSR